MRPKAILAGVSIGIASLMFLKIGGIVGAILFSFGLIVVVSNKWELFTGMSGFHQKGEVPKLISVLLFNIIGCILVSLLAPTAVCPIILSRLSTGWLTCFFLAIGCGFIMSEAVYHSREGNWLPLLFGVPVFILCGFPYCVADVVYYASCPIWFLCSHWVEIASIYVSTIIGNYIGCNLRKIATWRKFCSC